MFVWATVSRGLRHSFSLFINVKQCLRRGFVASLQTFGANFAGPSPLTLQVPFNTRDKFAFGYQNFSHRNNARILLSLLGGRPLLLGGRPGIAVLSHFPQSLALLAGRHGSQENHPTPVSLRRFDICTLYILIISYHVFHCFAIVASI